MQPPQTPPSDPSESVYRFQVSQYVVVACLTLCVWDWFLALSDEFDMVRYGERRRRYLLHGVYFISRLSPIIYLTVTIVLKSAPINTCQMIARLIGATNIVIMPAISGLFFVRLSAVYSYNKYVVAFFGSCWLAVLGFFVFAITSVIWQYSDDSKQCFAIGRTDAWGYIATGVYDTLMYLGGSHRLLWQTAGNCE